MNISTNLNYLSAGLQFCIDPLPIPLDMAMIENEKYCDIININMHWDPVSATWETYKLKTTDFKNLKPEEFLAIMNNLKTVIDGAGTMFTP